MISKRPTIITKALEGLTVFAIPTGNNVRRGHNGGELSQVKQAVIIKVAKVFVTIKVAGSSYEQKYRINAYAPNCISMDNSGYELYGSQAEVDGFILTQQVERQLRKPTNLTAEQAAGIAKVMDWDFSNEE